MNPREIAASDQPLDVAHNGVLQLAEAALAWRLRRSVSRVAGAHAPKRAAPAAVLRFAAARSTTEPVAGCARVATRPRTIHTSALVDS